MRTCNQLCWASGPFHISDALRKRAVYEPYAPKSQVRSMALIRPSIDLRQFSFSEEGSTYNERSRNAFVSCQLCVCCVIARVRCHLLQQEQPGLQLAGPRFEPRRRSSLSSGAAARAKERAGRQPPVTRGRWRGALLQVAGHIVRILPVCT